MPGANAMAFEFDGRAGFLLGLDRLDWYPSNTTEGLVATADLKVIKHDGHQTLQMM